MKSIKRLSSITGFDSSDFMRFLNIRWDEVDGLKLTVDQLVTISRHLGESACNRGNYIILLTEEGLFRGVIIQDSKDVKQKRNGIPAIIVTYLDAKGERHIEELTRSNNMYQNDPYYDYGIKVNRIFGFLIPVKNEKMFDSPQPVGGFYDTVFESEIISVGKNEYGYFFVNSDHERVSVYFDEIIADSCGVFRLKKESLYGLADANGNVIIYPCYLEINPFSEGLAAFKQLKLWGFLDTMGNIAVPPRYNTVEAFEKGHAIVSLSFGQTPALQLKNPQGTINTKGNAIIKEDDNKELTNFCFVIPFGAFYIGVKHSPELVGSFNSPKLYLLAKEESNSTITIGGTDHLFFSDQRLILYDEERNLYGLISSDKTRIINCSFISILKRTKEKIIGYVPSIKNSLKPASETTENGWTLLDRLAENEKEQSISTRDDNGCWLFPDGRRLDNSAKYEQCVEIVLRDTTTREIQYVYVVEENGKYGIVDSSNNIIIKIDFDDLVLPSAHDHLGHWGVTEWLSINGKESSYHIFYVLDDNTDSRVIVQKEGKWYAYSYNGKRIWNKGYKTVLNYADSFIVQGEEGFGIMIGDEIVSPCHHSRISAKLNRNNVGSIESTFFLLQKDNKTGLFIVTPKEDVVFHSIGVSYEDLCICGNRVIVKKGKRGLLDYNGSVILDIGYDGIEYISEQRHYIVTIDGVQGVVGEDGEVVISIDYRHIAYSGGVYYLVDKNNLSGVYGIIPCSYSRINSLRNCFVAEKKKQRYFISADGKKVLIIDSCRYLDKVSTCGKKPLYGKDEYQNFLVSNPHFREEYNYPVSDLFEIRKKGKAGAISHTGDIIVPCNYDGVGFIGDGVILAWTENEMLLYSIDGKQRSSLYNSIKALSTYEARYDYPAFYVSNGDKTGLLLFKDLLFQEEYPCVFDELVIGRKHAFFEDRFIIDGINKRESVLGPDGNKLDVPAGFLWMSDFSYRDLSVAVKEGRFGIIDSSFNVLRDFTYDSILKIDASHYLVSLNDRSYLVRYDKNHIESELHTYSFSVIKRVATNRFCIKKDNKYGVYRYDETKEDLVQLLDIHFNSISGYDDTFIIVKKGELFGCYDKEGNVLLEEKYLSIQPMYNKRDRTSKDYPFDFVKGNLLIARHNEKDGDKYLTTLYSYKSNNSIIINQLYISVNYFSEYHKEHGVYIEYKDSNNKYGVIDNDCSHSSDTFDKIETCYRYNNTPGFYTYDGKAWGYIDYKSFNTIPCRFNQKVYFGDELQRFWVLENQETKVKQFYDSQLKQVCTIPNMVDIKPFSNDKWLVSVRVGDSQLCGLYNDIMEAIIPPSYYSITEGIKNQYIASVKAKHSYEMAASAIYDSDGNILSPLSDGAISFYRSSSDDPGVYQKKGDVTRVSYNGIDFIECEDNPKREYISWGSTHYYSDSNDDGTKNIITGFGVEYFYVEESYTQDNITILKVSGKYIVINNEKELSTESHERITINSNAKYISLIDGDSRRFIDYEGVPIGAIKGKFSTCVLQKEAKVICGITKDTEGKKQYRLYSDSGALLNNTVFSYIGAFSEGFATCVINSENPIDKDFFKHVRDFDYIDADHGQWGLIDSKGRIVIPMRFDFIRPVKNGLTVYSKDYKFGVINPSKGKSTVAKYKYLDSFHDGLCRFRLFTEDDNPNGWYKSYKYSNFGFIDASGKEVIPPVFFKVTNFKSGIADVESRGGYKNQIDKEGNLLHDWNIIDCRDMDDNDYYDPNDGIDYERERWFALTDGQYGDFPGGHPDYDGLGF